VKQKYLFVLLIIFAAFGSRAQSTDSLYVPATVYPNPFSSKVSIKHNKKEGQIQEISIYDAIGNEVYSFPKEEFDNSILVWYGTNYGGVSLNSGTYICYIRTRKRSESVLLQKQ
jgi:Secretion system C-terminal sorting domain